MLDLYEASLDTKYLKHARTLAGVILERFIDKEKAILLHLDDHDVDHALQAAFDGSRRRQQRR